MADLSLQARLLTALSSTDKQAIRADFNHHHPADIAKAMVSQPDAAIAKLLQLLPLPDQTDLFSYLAKRQQAALVEELPRNDMAALVSAMDADERADLFHSLGDQQRIAILPGLAHAEREDIRRLCSYPERTAGALMTSSYATLSANLTVKQAIRTLRLEAPDKETIYQAYVLTEDRRLLGTISLKQLILSPSDVMISSLMKTEVVAVATDLAQEQVVEKVRQYDLIALPVLDDNNQLVGIISYDDAMDAAEEEATDDAQKSASVASMRSPLSQASISELYRKRIGWLVLLVFGALLSGAGLAFFEDTLEAHIALVFFMPLLVGSGGNAGSQAAALMVRALATGDVVLKDWFRVLAKDLLVASALGISMGITVFALGYVRSGPEIAIVVALAMVCVVLVGSFIGLSLPFILSRFKLDPATASGPLVTTIVDASGVIIYFGFATWILQIN
ncbi:magnesium transporter MgtE [Neiella marina]|uniref:Magnesium transporter MgtE n=1 Tax=Neiella marina TaxID=508461 RepID=A0A8J2U4U9_9GAMM|nr:magnesium transporter [Neiella marina]GGA75433.1 magnesium transporter MgtE [Neiella marina]